MAGQPPLDPSNGIQWLAQELRELRAEIAELKGARTISGEGGPLANLLAGLIAYANPGTIVNLTGASGMTMTPISGASVDAEIGVSETAIVIYGSSIGLSGDGTSSTPASGNVYLFVDAVQSGLAAVAEFSNTQAPDDESASIMTLRVLPNLTPGKRTFDLRCIRNENNANIVSLSQNFLVVIPL